MFFFYLKEAALTDRSVPKSRLQSVNHSDLSVPLSFTLRPPVYLRIEDKAAGRRSALLNIANWQHTAPAACYYLLTERGKSMTNSSVHQEKMAALQRAPLVASRDFLFFTSAELRIWCPNALVTRRSRVPVCMPVKRLFSPVESSLGDACTTDASSSALERNVFMSWSCKEQHLSYSAMSNLLKLSPHTVPEGKCLFHYCIETM